MATTLHLEVKVAYMSLIQIGLTMYLLSVAVGNINDPTSFPEVNIDKLTLWAMNHYKINQEGGKYFNYSDPKIGRESTAVLTNQIWFDELLKGRYIYYFGLDFDNYCWPREIPTAEWLPSLFRSSQLKPWVPLRAAILLGITVRAFQAVVMAFLRLHRGPFCSFDKFLVTSFVLNELVHNVSLFYVSNYLVTPDQKYLFLFGPALTVAFITFGLKMLFSLWHSSLHFTTVIRLLLFVVVSFTFSPIYNNCIEYLHYNYCDPYAAPLVAFNEAIALFCLLVAEILDVIQTWRVEFMIGPSEEESCAEESLQTAAY